MNPPRFPRDSIRSEAAPGDPVLRNKRGYGMPISRTISDRPFGPDIAPDLENT